MSEGKNTYEGMFLVPPSQSDFEHAGQPIRAVLDRSEAEILSIKPWDERRLAYDIRGNRRGLYVLTYFKVAPDRISEIEHECQLNEGILRVLILRRDQVTAEQLEAQTPAAARAERMQPVDRETPSGGGDQTDKKEQAAPAAAQPGGEAAPQADGQAAEVVAAAAPAAEPAAVAEAVDAGSDGPVEQPDAPAAAPAIEAPPAAPAEPAPVEAPAETPAEAPVEAATAAEPAAPDSDVAPAEDDSQNPT